MKLPARKLVLIGLPVAVLLIVGAVIALITTHHTSNNDVLTPKTVLKMGNYRYVSPCQVLPSADTQRIFGTFKDKASYDQEYFDRSVSDQELTKSALAGLETSCTYNFGDYNSNSADGTDTTLKVTLDNFVSADAARKQLQSFDDLGSGKTTKELAAIPAGGVDDAFVDVLKQLNTENVSQLGAVRLPGLNPDVLYQNGEGKFLAVRGNSVISLTYQSGGSNFFDEARQVNQAAALKLRGEVNKSYAVILKNYVDSNLSQAPLPSQAGTEAQYVSGDRYLEPCALLTSAGFTATTKQPTDNSAIESNSLEYNTAARRSRNTNDLYKSPDASCTRTSLAKAADASEHSYSVILDAKYAPSQAKAAAMAQAYLLDDITQKGQVKLPTEISTVAGLEKYKAVHTLMGTTADSTYVFDNGSYAQPSARESVLYFSKGSYVFRVIVTLDHAAGDTTAAKVPTDQQYVAIVNSIVGNL